VLLLSAGAHAQRPNQGEDESAAFVEEGRAALRANKLDDAAKALDQAISLNPRRVEAYVLRSAVFTAKKQYEGGIEVLRRAQKLAPQDTAVLTALGTDLVLAGQRDEGIPLLEQVVAKEPERYDAQLLLGNYFHDTGKWPDAIAAFEAYFGKRPAALAKEDERHEVDLADSYLRYRQPQKALALFEKAAHGKNELRARIGAAWATAAIDCKKARGMLHDLEPIAEQHPEVWLVDGQCALALGDPGGALAQGRRYLDKQPRGTAAGHALVGEAHAARGNLGEARKELETAVALEPGRRRWPVRLAYVLRRAGKPADALATLDRLGPPSAPGIDPDWYLEVGEALLAQGDAKAAVSRLGAVVRELPGDAELRTVLGAAQLAAGQGEDAITSLDEAEGIRSTPRSKKLLATALTTVAAAKLSANDAAAAEPLLARAEPLDPGDAVVLRDLGIARLALDKPAGAVPILDRAIKIDTSGITWMLAARAHALAGDIAAARPLYERAVDLATRSASGPGADKDDAVEISLDWAATELAPNGDPAIAVTALERTQPQAKSGPLAARHKTALADARHAAGLAALHAGNGPHALELLRAAVSAESTLAAKCDLAVAAVAANDTSAALAALKAISGQACPFPPPADTQAAPILVAFTEGLSLRRAPRALERLTALAPKATGPAAAMLGTAIRVVALNAAQDAYRAGSLSAARKYLATAKAAKAKTGTDEVAHNLAVLDLADGKIDAAIAQLERLAPRVPEALVNLGIAYERKGDHQKALDAWRRAKKAGVRFPQLQDWIDAKERIYGGEP
jgi:tetratricopeptide (TPR) repeat protein